MTDGTPDLASAAKSAADFLDSYTDESELAQRSPLLVEIMRAHAAEVRAALAAHDQQDEPTAAIPLPGEGWYSVTVEHLVDKFEKQHPTQTWEVVSRCDGGGFSVEPVTYPEPGVSDTPEPPPSTQRRVDVSDDDPSELRGVRLMREGIEANEANAG